MFIMEIGFCNPNENRAVKFASIWSKKIARNYGTYPRLPRREKAIPAIGPR